MDQNRTSGQPDHRWSSLTSVRVIHAKPPATTGRHPSVSSPPGFDPIDRFRLAHDPSAKPGADSPESRFLATHLQGRSSGRDDRRRLQVRAESQQTTIAILHHELARVPGHVGKSPGEFYALGCVLGIKCVGIFDEQVRVEQCVLVLSGLAVGGSAQRK